MEESACNPAEILRNCLPDWAQWEILKNCLLDWAELTRNCILDWAQATFKKVTVGILVSVSDIV